MVNMEPIVATYFIPFFGMLFLLFFVNQHPLFEKKQTNLFKIAILVTLLLIICTSIDYICANIKFEYNWAIRRITSFANFAFSPVIPYILLKIYNYKKIDYKYFIPVVINFVLCFISIFYNLIFFINEKNQYSRGPLFFIPIVTSLFLMFILIAVPAQQNAKSKQNERYFLSSICLLILLSMYFEIAEGYRFLDWAVASIGLILYYLLLSIHGSVIDSLTGAYNRFMYSRMLSDIESQKDGIFVTIDINNFKDINDNFGHDAGDNYLISFVSFISKHLESCGTVYRIGGDEFFVFVKKTTLEHVEELLNQAVLDGEKENISFAYGIAAYHPHLDLQEILKEADKRMYIMKRKMKGMDN